MNDDTNSLFGELPATVPAAPPTTSGARRRARNATAVRHGAHPLTVALGYTIPLHPDAADADGPRCGSCRHRVRVGGGDRTWPKCSAGGGQGWPRATHGAATDVLASWPACTDYQPKGDR
ncbi:hypothetical protein [Saccharothrix lopnurensis]|uniref:Uncharacterized protein n=1 Tax=Saccharothrix lopnurensis TaxID=1670621 RepID=A0ABW1P880_9PSEU